MSCFGMNAGTEVISNMGVSGDTYFEMTMALISTRTITELFAWLKGEGPPLNLVIHGAGPLQRYSFQEEKITGGGGCFCFCGSGYQAAAVFAAEMTGYTIQDAIYELLALYLEEDLQPLGGSLQFVKNNLCLKADSKDKQGVSFVAPPKMSHFMQIAQQDPDLKFHILAVLWSQLPLHLDLKTSRDASRPQKLSRKYGQTSFLGSQLEVILNPNAQVFWNSLMALKVCRSQILH